MQCKKCRWWDEKRAWGEKKDKAPCRIMPPSIRPSTAACDPNGQWPHTHASDWCGAFVERN